MGKDVEGYLNTQNTHCLWESPEIKRCGISCIPEVGFADGLPSLLKTERADEVMVKEKQLADITTSAASMEKQTREGISTSPMKARATTWKKTDCNMTVGSADVDAAGCSMGDLDEGSGTGLNDNCHQDENIDRVETRGVVQGDSGKSGDYDLMTISVEGTNRNRDQRRKVDGAVNNIRRESEVKMEENKDGRGDEDDREEGFDKSQCLEEEACINVGKEGSGRRSQPKKKKKIMNCGDDIEVELVERANDEEETIESKIRPRAVDVDKPLPVLHFKVGQNMHFIKTRYLDKNIYIYI